MLQVCLFQLAGETFALRLDAVSEIVPMAELSRPPSSPTILEGFLNLAGDAIPVLKISDLLGLPSERLELHTPLLIVRVETMRLALLVRSVTDIVGVSIEDVVQIGATDSFNGCVEGRLSIGGAVVHLLSIERLLLEKERHTLEDFQATETRRLRQIESVAS